MGNGNALTDNKLAVGAFATNQDLWRCMCINDTLASRLDFNL